MNLTQGNLYDTCCSWSDSLVANSYTWLLAVLIPLLLNFHLQRTRSDGKLYVLGGLPILPAWTFFSRRYDFMKGNFKFSGGLPFRFRVLQHRVVAVTGQVAGEVFFNDPRLNLAEGYCLLFGAVPRVEEVGAGVDVCGVGNVNGCLKRLSLLLRKGRVTESKLEVLPLIMDDVGNEMSDWGPKGIINPFKEVYDLVLQITVHMATCRELSQDRKAIQKMANLYGAVEKSSTPLALLLPWFPSPSKVMKTVATTRLYFQLVKYVRHRRAAGATTSDAFDVLIQTGASDAVIVQTALAIIFAGVINTGVNACWALLHLGLNPTWRQRVISELQSLLSQFCDPSSSEPLHRKLATIPLSAWENDLPSLDLTINETIRISFSGTFLRRNVGGEMEVQGAKVQRGDFVVFAATDVHLSEDIYTDPETFDPARFELGQEEDKKVPIGYLGWGFGRHPCAGIKLAKLEIKAIVAMFLLGYHYEVVDETGSKTDHMPKPDRNDMHKAQPLGKPVYLKYTRRD